VAIGVIDDERAAEVAEGGAVHIVNGLVTENSGPLLRHGPLPCRACTAEFDAKVKWLYDNPAFLDSDTPIPPDARPADRNRQL